MPLEGRKKGQKKDNTIGTAGHGHGGLRWHPTGSAGPFQEFGLILGGGIGNWLPRTKGSL